MATERESARYSVWPTPHTTARSAQNRSASVDVDTSRDSSGGGAATADPNSADGSVVDDGRREEESTDENEDEDTEALLRWPGGDASVATPTFFCGELIDASVLVLALDDSAASSDGVVGDSVSSVSARIRTDIVSVGVWVCGCVGVWVCGCVGEGVGVWVCG